MARKFKVGDLVRVARIEGGTIARFGMEARIVEVEPESYNSSLVYRLEDPDNLDAWAAEEDLEPLVEGASAAVPEVPSTSPLTEDERFFAYSLIQNGHDVERVLDIIRTLRKGV